MFADLLYVLGGAVVVGVAVVLVVAGLVVTRCRHHRGKTYTLGAGQEAGETLDPSPPLMVDSSPSPSPPTSLDPSSSSLGRACTPV